MKKLLKNRAFALLVCLLAIAGSIFFSSQKGLSALVDEVELQFVEGAGEDEGSIYSDLQSRVGLARNFIVIAERYLNEDDKNIEAAEAAAKSLDGETDPGDAYEANVELEYAVQALNIRLMEQELSATDESTRSGIITDLADSAYKISHDDYNTNVRTLNEDVLSSFPASLLKLVTFVGDAELFN